MRSKSQVEVACGGINKINVHDLLGGCSDLPCHFLAYEL